MRKHVLNISISKVKPDLLKILTKSGYFLYNVSARLILLFPSDHHQFLSPPQRMVAPQPSSLIMQP